MARPAHAAESLDHVYESVVTTTTTDLGEQHPDARLAPLTIDTVVLSVVPHLNLMKRSALLGSRHRSS